AGAALRRRQRRGAGAYPAGLPRAAAGGGSGVAAAVLTSPAPAGKALPGRGDELLLHRPGQQVRRQQALVEQEVVERQPVELRSKRQLGVHAQLQDAAVAVEIAAGLAWGVEHVAVELLLGHRR